MENKEDMKSNDVKITMILTEQDVSNAELVKESLCLHSKAAAVSDAMAVTAKLIELVKNGNEILIHNEKGKMEQLVFTNMKYYNII